MFGSEKKEQARQFNQQMDQSAEANDSNVAVAMSKPEVAYDPQVSAMLLDVQRRFLKWKIVRTTNGVGQEEFKWECAEKYPYKEPYSDEALAFMEDDEEKKLLNMFGSTMAQVKTVADKNDFDWHYAFNNIVAIRENFLLNSRTTGKPGKLSKSQFVDSTAAITRSVVPPKKKGWLGGLFG